MRIPKWICVSIMAGGIALFLSLDGPLRTSNWIHAGKTTISSPPLEKLWIADPAISAMAEKIVALTIERVAGGWPGNPVYIFRLERGRKASYEGKESVPQIGRYIGTRFQFDNFRSLAYFAAARLLVLKDNYETGLTDHTTKIVTIEMTDGVKRISDYADSGPNDLLMFCTALDGVASSIEWVPEKKANHSPESTPSAVH